MDPEVLRRARSMRRVGDVVMAIGWVFVALSCATLIWYVEHLRRHGFPLGDAVGLGAAGILFLVAPSLGVVLIGVVTRSAAAFWAGQADGTSVRASSPVRPASRI